MTLARTARATLVAGALAVACPRAATATPPPSVCNRSYKAEKSGLDPHRYELAGFPIIGGNTDIGVQFGGAATLTRFCGDVQPYQWNIDLLLSASAKDDSSGLRLVQQSHVLRLDAPALFGGRVRVDGRLNYLRTINAGYYGLGNDSSAALPPGVTDPGRRFQYLQQEGRARFITRIHTSSPLDLALGLNLRYESPGVYDGSRLAADALAQNREGDPRVRGLDPAAIAGVAAGVMYDTRDTEFVTTKGIFYQLGVGASAGSSDGIGYGDTSAVLSHYAPLPGPFIFASRLVASFQFGNVPFYDLMQGGTFEPQYLFGGETGVRGVPDGRYAGKVKLVTNIEIRSRFPRFQLLGQRLRIGTTTFLDAGRLWDEYSYDPGSDGRKLGLKYGVGGGFFLQWGEAAIFRIEAAYSPDAVAENPGFPIGLYVSDGLMF